MTDTAKRISPSPSVSIVFASALGVLVAMIAAIIDYAALDAGTLTKLSGIDSSLTVPSTAWSIVWLSVIVTWSVASLAGARYPHGIHVAAIVVTALGTLYQVGAVLFNFGWATLVLLIIAVAVLYFTIRACRASKNADDAPQVARNARTWVLGGFLVIAGIAGLLAAYSLSVEKVVAIVQPGSKLGCDFSIFVQCSANLGSAQGAVLGFPNPLLGLGGFAVPLVIGIAILAGARFARWYWLAFNVGVVLALALVIFLIGSSIYALHTLCPWCSLVWTVTIPMFWLVTLYSFKTGVFRVSPRATEFFAGAYTWTPLITLISYLVVATLFQVQLNVIQYF
ncbi:MAG TPA: vitamin K epoxide reductase family protein [Galbitalea sp.]